METPSNHSYTRHSLSSPPSPEGELMETVPCDGGVPIFKLLSSPPSPEGELMETLTLQLLEELKDITAHRLRLKEN